MRERLVKTEVTGDNYRAQQAEGLITMAKLRERLDELAQERAGLEARLAKLTDAEQRLQELEALPGLVEEYLADLPNLIGRMPQGREYETVPEQRTPENPLGVYTLTPERIRHKNEEELVAEQRQYEADRGAKFRELYGMLGLRAAAHADGTLEITVGATNTKGVMPCGESGS